MRISKSTKTSVKAATNPNKVKFEVLRTDFDGEVSGYKLGNWYLMKIYGWGDIVNWYIFDEPKNHLYECEKSKMGYVGDGNEQGWVRSCKEGKQILIDRYLAENGGETGDVQASSSTDKALQHITAAIDILGKSGNKDAVTKDSIANLATVMFDIKASKK